MKSLVTGLVFCGCLFMISCVSKKKTTSPPIKFAPPPVKIEPAPVDADSLIPFTRDIYNRLRDANLDIRKLQFYVDQTIVLSRGKDMSQYDIDNTGKLVYKYGMDENKKELLALTPGIVEAIEPDGLRISFEPGANIKFINNKYSPEFFIFSGNNWDRGTAEINYKGTNYRASCGTCGSVGEARLVVRKKDIDANNTKGDVIGGRTIGSRGY